MADNPRDVISLQGWIEDLDRKETLWRFVATFEDDTKLEVIARIPDSLHSEEFFEWMFQTQTLAHKMSSQIYLELQDRLKS